MKYALAFALVGLFLCGVAPAAAQEQAKPEAPAEKVDVTGVWDMTVETPSGPIQNVSTLKQEGEKLTGTMAGQMGEFALEGTVVSNEIKWILNIDMGGQQMSIPFAGKVEGDKMTGLFEFSGMGSLAWSAVKRKQ